MLSRFKLKHQLLLVSLVTLALPWAGCQYVATLEQGLLDRRQADVMATAKAQAVAMSVDPVWREPALAADLDAGEKVVYANTASAPLQLDGYDADWRASDVDTDRFASESLLYEPHIFKPRLPSLRAEARFALHADHLWLSLDVSDATRDSFDPSMSVQDIDRIIVRLVESERLLKSFVVVSSAPGSATILDAQTGLPIYDGSVDAVWRETPNGYQVEMRLSLSGLEQAALQIEVADRSQRMVSLSEEPLPIVIAHPPLVPLMARFADEENVRQSIVSPEGWLLARHGAIRAHQSDGARYQPFWRRVQRTLLGGFGFPEWAEFGSAQSVPRLSESAAVFNWYKHRQMMVAQALVPVDLPQGRRAVYVYERGLDSVDSLTRQALTGVFGTALGAAIVAVLALLAFASLLSYRIRRLSQAAKAAVDRKGRLTGRFEASHEADEIGGLSRQFASLLQKQAEHQRYLETLAQKLSHELRTPLAVIRSSLEHLQMGPACLGEDKPYVERAMSGVERLSSTLNAMVDASRLEQSIFRQSPENVALKPLLGAVCAAYQDLYRPQKADIRLHFEVSQAPLIVSSSEDLIVQWLDKLVENAVDFHQADTAIWISVRPLQDKPGLSLSVQNLGRRVSEEQLSSLSEPLVSFREDVSREGASGQEADAPAERHLGLGLYVARLIAQWHGSELRVIQESTDDPSRTRMCFEMDLPMAPDASDVPFDLKNSV